MTSPENKDSTNDDPKSLDVEGLELFPPSEKMVGSIVVMGPSWHWEDSKIFMYLAEVYQKTDIFSNNDDKVMGVKVNLYSYGHSHISVASSKYRYDSQLRRSLMVISNDISLL